MNERPNQLPSDDSQRPAESLDLYVDEQLHGEQRAAFEQQLGRESTLNAAYHRQRAIDSSLRRMFPAPAIDGHADRIVERAIAQLPPAEHNGHPALERAASVTLVGKSKPAPARRRQPFMRGWLAIAAMITLFIGVPSAFWLWHDTIFPPRSPYAVGRAEPLDVLYREQVTKGFKPDWVCNDQREFASYFAGRLGQPLMIHDAPAGAAMLGLSYTGGVTPSSMGMLGTANGKSVLVVVDQVSNDAKAQMKQPGDLKLFKRKIGSLMLYEITPLEEPKLLEMFYQPEMPTTAEACMSAR
jgi:hypothetical protein